LSCQLVEAVVVAGSADDALQQFAVLAFGGVCGCGGDGVAVLGDLGHLLR
jgi:hypothetical protein